MNQETVFNQSNTLMQKNDYWFDLLYGKQYFDSSQDTCTPLLSQKFLIFFPIYAASSIPTL